MASFLYAIVMTWRDDRLRFDPKDFNNANFICLPMSELWVPTFQIANAVETKRVNDGNVEDDVEVRSDGTVTIADIYYSKTICGTRTNRFPFDIQFCDVDIENLNINQTLMRF
ncbi:unnamed protein product, partial [Mesorhabditis belari]|uniref:Neurotransmitter-gated ion-channel ligand-binding domain-containing protein n=1 Tax=Mesorhabditis belari TaxID=2138241 RepID=A0AAF3J2N0_9BILA